MRFPTRHLGRKGLLTLVLASAAALIFTPLMLGRRPMPTPAAGTGATTPAATERAREAYGRIPLSFEANHGQAEEGVNFLARGAGYALLLKPGEAVFRLRGAGDSRTEDETIAARHASVLRMRLVGADDGAAAEAEGELEGKVNYFIGSDPSRWRAGLPTYARVRYREIYPGTDVVYYGNQRQLEYDFVVAPGRDPGRIALKFEGAERIEVDAGGDLLLTLVGGAVRQPKPFVYQEVAGARREVEGGYAVGPDGRVGFRLGEYDPALPLVIDPVIVYSTYLGGGGADEAREIAVDSSGSAYLCGETTSTNFPTANAFDATFAGGAFVGARDAFVTKLNPAGTALVYSTYLGSNGAVPPGNGDDRCFGIAVDAAGNAYLAGETHSNDFPTANAVQATYGGGLSDAFVTKLNATGSALVYSTFLGGNIFDAAASIALDSSNNAYVTGRTTSANFPTANAIQATQANADADAFVTKINAAGTALVYSTYLGGSGGEAFDAGSGIAVDSAGNAYVAGQTTSTNFPTANAIQPTFGSGSPNGDAFVTKINAAGTAFIYSTYLGGTGDDFALDIAADVSGNAHVTGVTPSSNFPTANALQATLSGTTDAFVTKLNPTGSAFIYSTFLGGSGGDAGNGIEADASGNTYVVGGTDSTNFPTANAVQATNAGGIDTFVTKLNAAGSALVFSTYVGGSTFERADAAALDSSNNVYVCGLTDSTNFPTATPFQATNAGGRDAFVFKLSDPPPATSTFQFSAATYEASEGPAFLGAAGIGSGEASELEALRAAAVGSAVLQVTRTGDLSQPAEVTYATVPGTASDRGDYTAAYGTLRFAANEQSKTLVVLITDDVFQEAAESFTVVLSNPNGAGLGTPATATVAVTSDDAATGPNPVKQETLDTDKFVRYHYADFLNRLPDAEGLAFWKAQLDGCGADLQCRDVRMVNVSAAFFLSIEFQQTGYLVYRMHQAAFNTGERLRLPRFLADTQEIRAGVIVGQGSWEQQLEANKQQFAERFVVRPEFLALYPAAMAPAAFVDALNANAGGALSQAERDAAVAQLTAAGNTAPARARALRTVAEDEDFARAQFNRAFVYMQYVGYLRRDPDAPPDTNFEGYNYWLNKLNQFNGDFVQAEMVRAFIVSAEYQNRFGP